MGGAADDDLRLGREGPADQIRRAVVEVAQADRGLAAPHQVAHLVAGRRAQAEVDVWIPDRETPQRGGKVRPRQRAHCRQRQRTGLAAPDRVDRVTCIAEGCQHALGMRKQGLADLADDHPAGHSLEKRRAQLALKQRDAPADRRLRAVQAARSGGEPASAVDGDEGLQGFGIHAAMLCKLLMESR